MKTKILLLGTNNAVIDDFFRQMDEMFEMQTASLRFDDILGHMKYFKPNAIIICLHRESRENITLMVSIKQRLRGEKIPFVIIGDAQDCDAFTKTAVNIADLVLVKPLTSNTISQKLTDYLKRHHITSSEDTTPQKPVKEETNKPDPVMSQVSDILAELDSTPTNTRKHILVVDDDVRMLRVIKRHLEADYDIATAVNGALALRFLEKKSTDLILLDYEMPDEKGPDVLKKIRAKEATKDVPVIFLTGAAEREKIQTALALKPQGYLLKPVERDSLLKRIQELIG